MPKMAMSRCPDSRRDSIMTEKVGMRNSDSTDWTVTRVLTRWFSGRSASCFSEAPTPGSLNSTATKKPARMQMPPMANMP
jgi:hypothetical protein